ncbi:MAG: hypothetical protein NC433_07780 [Clostridiales bacterium]|nr:hypothetical protein [Clostridiales bacterium]
MSAIKIYNNLPLIMQNTAVTAKGAKIQKTRYGNTFKKHYIACKEREQWSLKEKMQYRDAKIREMVCYCYRHVPFYKRLFDKNNVNIESISGLDDLWKIPIIDKAIVRENYEDFQSDEYVKNKSYVKHLHTSGTTGAGLDYRITNDADAEAWAIGWREHEKIGIHRGMWCAYFAGKPIVPASQKKPPYYRINYAGRQIMFSTFHMNNETLYSYIDAMNKYQPQWLQGYPSAVGLLASFINETGYRLTYQIKTITLASESVTERQRNEIKKAFSVNPFQTYGQTEAVAYFRDYIPGELYVIEDYSAVEFIQMDDGMTHIVGTSFWNKAMPLLRYDTHDLAEVEKTQFGRKICSIDGRVEDYIVLDDGSKIGRLGHTFKTADNVIEAQIVQVKKTFVKILIVKSNLYCEKDEKKIKELINERFGDRIQYEIQYVEKIPRTNNGKLRFVVSELK